MKVLKTIFSALLALVVLISTTSFTIERHICMGRVQSVAILHNASPCAMEMFAKKGQGMLGMEGCCQDEQTKIEGNEYQVKTLKPVELEYQSLWIAELPRLIETLDFNCASSQHTFVLYKPPLIEQDVPVLIQSFLI